MAKNIKRKYDIAIVEWLDAESIDEWTENVLIDHSVAKVVSIGFLLKSDKQGVTLALNHDTKNDAHSCIMKIPNGMIVSKRVFKS
jgi:hypothetical protein